jgi:hypothetical protein
MKYIYTYPVDKFDKNADNEIIISAWKKGEAIRYTPEEFAELINDEQFCEVENRVRVIGEDEGNFEIISLHRDDLELSDYDTSQTDDSVMRKPASKLPDEYREQLFWSSLSILADSLGIPQKRKRKINCNVKLIRKRRKKQ